MNSPIFLFLRLVCFPLLLLRAVVFGDFYTACSNNFNCGETTAVGFPFWGGGRPPNCGHPALKLTIARADYMDGLCPNKFVNTTLDYNLFDSIPGYRNITLIYCSSPIEQVAGQFSCTEYNFGIIQVDTAAGPGLCNASVITPVNLDSVATVSALVNSTEILNAIKEGFEVRLKEDGGGCRVCEASEGVCGYDLGSNRTTCFCRGGGNGGVRSCRNMPAGEGPASSPGDQNRKLKIIVGMVKRSITLINNFKHLIKS